MCKKNGVFCSIEKGPMVWPKCTFGLKYKIIFTNAHARLFKFKCCLRKIKSVSTLCCLCFCSRYLSNIFRSLVTIVFVTQAAACVVHFFRFQFTFLQSVEVCNAVYGMNWTTLRVRVMKDLALMMMRASKPFRMSSGYLVTLTNESFMSVSILEIRWSQC